jgi:hypothetical protein
VGDLYVIRSPSELDYFCDFTDESKAVALPSYLFNKYTHILAFF